MNLFPTPLPPKPDCNGDACCSGEEGDGKLHAHLLPARIMKKSRRIPKTNTDVDLMEEDAGYEKEGEASVRRPLLQTFPGAAISGV
jgi:hypothetical protein